MTHLIRASILALACMTAATSNADEKKEAREREKYRKEHERACKALKMEPLKLDRSTVMAGETLKATSALVNGGKAVVVIPKAPGDSPSKIPTLGSEYWYLRRTDIRPSKRGREKDSAARTEESLDSGDKVYRHGLAHWRSEIKPGERIELNFRAGEVDPERENLQTGSYEIILEFVGESGFKWTAAAPFKVVNTKALDPAVVEKQQAERVAKIRALMAQFYPSIEVIPLTASATTIRQGGTLDVVGGLRNKTRADLRAPLSKDPQLEWELGVQQWLLGRRDEGPAGGGGGQKGYGGGTFSLAGREKLAPGEVLEFNKTVTTHDLKPGTYEISLQISDGAGNKVGLQSLRFRVTE